MSDFTDQLSPFVVLCARCQVAAKVDVREAGFDDRLTLVLTCPACEAETFVEL